MRDALKKVSLKRRKELGEDIGLIFEEIQKDKAMKKALEVADKWRKVSPRVAALIDNDIEHCLNALAFPIDHQVSIRTNNMMERLNEEIRRRDRVIGIFPNEESALRLICSLCIEKSEQWLEGKAFLDMSLLDADDDPVPAVVLYKRFIKEERMVS